MYPRACMRVCVCAHGREEIAAMSTNFCNVSEIVLSRSLSAYVCVCVCVMRCAYVCVSMCRCICIRVYACVRACVRACVCARNEVGWGWGANCVEYELSRSLVEGLCVGALNKRSTIWCLFVFMCVHVCC